MVNYRYIDNKILKSYNNFKEVRCIILFRQELLAQNIIRYRKRLGMTQSELAAKLFVSAQSVSKWETGSSQPDLGNLCSLSRILGASTDELLGLGSDGNGRVFIGIDGGGTKTEFVAFTEEGIILKRLVLGGSNPNTVGLEKTCSVLKMGVDSLSTESTVGVFLGIAGCGSKENSEYITRFLEKNYPTLKLKCATDIFNVIGSVPEVGDCVAAICGTGSVVYGYTNGELYRVGGWGYLLDGLGSGFDIGSAAVRAALAERDDIGPHTLLTETVEQKLGSTVWEKINEIYQKPPSYLASFAPLVFEAARQNDEVALEIIRANAQRIAELIKHTVDTVKCPKAVIIAGSLASRETMLTDGVKSLLGEGWTITVPEMPQIYGACIEAMRLCGADITPLTENFKKQYERLI